MTYTQKDFERLILELREHQDKLLLSKGHEYATDAERLGNFKRIAAAEGRKPSQVAMTFFLKHVDSLAQATQRGETIFDWERPGGGEGLKQRLVDAQNYLFLLGACLEDEAKDKHLP